MRPISFTYAPTASGDNIVAAAQQLAGAGNLLINGSAASGGVATLGDQQFLLFTTTENDSGRTATITGTDRAGNAITESLTLPNSTTKASTKSFYTVSQIAIDGAIGANMKVGVNGLGYSRPYPLDVYLTPFSVSVAVDTDTGGATYKSQFTYDDIYASTWPNGTQHWFDSANMTGKTGAFVEALTAPIMAVRFVITTAQTGESISGRIIQAGGGL